MTEWIAELSDGRVARIEAAEVVVDDSGSLIFLRADTPPPSAMTTMLVLAPRLWLAVTSADSPVTWEPPPPAPPQKREPRLLPAAEPGARHGSAP